MPTIDVGSPVLVCDPCSGHISTENDIWMMVVMVVMPLELMPLHEEDVLEALLEMRWSLVKPTMSLHVHEFLVFDG